MSIYLNILLFQFQRFLAYPAEIWSSIIKRILYIGFLVVFWSMITKSSHGSISLAPLISYFFIASAINDIVSAHSLRFGGYIGDMIKKGTINSYLIRPLNIIPYLYSLSLGERSLGITLSLITFVIGILLHPPTTWLSVILFILFIALAILISFAINLLVGIVYFYTVEAKSFLYTVAHIVKVLSGAAIPLHYSPARSRHLHY